jgi:fructosamine-3-kinase
MDLAMLRLFGSVDEVLFDAYQAEWPLEAGWKDRIALNQIYPLLVHLNLFGGGYAAQVDAVLRRYA